MRIIDLDHMDAIADPTPTGGTLQSYILDVTNGFVKLNVNGQEVLNQPLTERLSKELNIDGSPLKIDISNSLEGFDLNSFTSQFNSGTGIFGKTRVLRTQSR